MTKMESTVVIARPVDEVFGFFLALDENAPKTDPSVSSVVKTPDGPVRAGTKFRFRQQNLGTSVTKPANVAAATWRTPKSRILTSSIGSWCGGNPDQGPNVAASASGSVCASV